MSISTSDSEICSYSFHSHRHLYTHSNPFGNVNSANLSTFQRCQLTIFRDWTFRNISFEHQKLVYLCNGVCSQKKMSSNFHHHKIYHVVHLNQMMSCYIIYIIYLYFILVNSSFKFFPCRFWKFAIIFSVRSISSSLFSSVFRFFFVFIFESAASAEAIAEELVSMMILWN